MPLTTERPALKLVREIKTTPDKVWEAWTSGEALKEWMMPMDGAQVRSAALEVKVEGRYRVVMRTPDGEDHEVSGIYREVVPPRRLVFTWVWKGTPERESLVTVELRATRFGTRLTLIHEQFFDDMARAQHELGWSNCLAQLERRLGEIGVERKI